jgi:hypothetical protein
LTYYEKASAQDNRALFNLALIKEKSSLADAFGVWKNYLERTQNDKAESKFHAIAEQRLKIIKKYLGQAK